jgi:hypothetical protein
MPQGYKTMFNKRLPRPTAVDTFDLAFRPLYPMGSEGKLVSAEELIMRRTVNDALEGKLKAINAILRYAKAQDAAQHKQRITAYGAPKPKIKRERDATKAMMLLSIACEDGRGRMMLEPWVARLALDRTGAPLFDETDIALSECYTRDGDTPAPAVYSLPVAPREPRSAAATQFKKGQSGNPRGRPRQFKLEVPISPYLEVVGEAPINGKIMRVTRLQYILHVFDRKAISGDPSFTAAMANRYLQEQLERHRRRMRTSERDRLYAHVNPERSALQQDPFETMLRTLRISNRRTVSRAKLEPWIVKAALARFGERRLTLAEQAEVWRSTSTPDKVQWPDWWEITSQAAAKPHLPVEPRKRKTATKFYTEEDEITRFTR